MDDDEFDEVILIDNDRINEFSYKIVRFSISCITLRKLCSIIVTEFASKSGNNIRIFNFYGIEFLDDSDLYVLESKNNNSRICYFSIQNRTTNKHLINCFKIKHKIGEGGFGKVFFCNQIFSNEMYAIKFIQLRKNMNIKYFLKEIESLRRLDHPKIIKLENYFCMNSNEIALLLEYAQGGTLKQLLKERGKIEEDEARIIISQVLEALIYCHSKELIHRDLKLDNIVFADKERKKIKLIDFGISGIQKEEINAGSVRYLPPEVNSGAEMSSNPGVDFWAVGCIMFEIITGEKLFKGETVSEIKKETQKGQVILANQMSVEACDLISWMVEVNPEKRPQMAGILDHSWIQNTKLPNREIVELKENQSSKSLSPLKKARKVTIKNLNESNSPKECSVFEQTLRSNSVANLDGKLKKVGVLATKVSKDTNNFRIIDMNAKLLKEYGKIPTYLQPIGHSKEQKLKYGKIKESLIIAESSITKRSINISKHTESSSSYLDHNDNDNSFHQKLKSKQSNSKLPASTIFNTPRRLPSKCFQISPESQAQSEQGGTEEESKIESKFKFNKSIASKFGEGFVRKLQKHKLTASCGFLKKN